MCGRAFRVYCGGRHMRACVLSGSSSLPLTAVVDVHMDMKAAAAHTSTFWGVTFDGVQLCSEQLSLHAVGRMADFSKHAEDFWWKRFYCLSSSCVCTLIHRHPSLGLRWDGKSSRANVCRDMESSNSTHCAGELRCGMLGICPVCCWLQVLSGHGQGLGVYIVIAVLSSIVMLFTVLGIVLLKK